MSNLPGRMEDFSTRLIQENRQAVAGDDRKEISSSLEMSAAVLGHKIIVGKI